MPRKPRFYVPHIPAHVIQRGNNRQAVCVCDDDYLKYLAWLKAGEYWWSSYRANALGESSAIRSEQPLYKTLGRTRRQRADRYRKFFCNELTPGQIDGIRAAVQPGTPLANDRFREQIEQTLSRKVGQPRRGRPLKSSFPERG